ncbi:MULTISPECIES: hypothetical protein [Bombella]|uniref:Secreted protein n=1 Tax=Bombella pollinis TaxID=2967337 RepID=A0ABT3WLH7_9PROT|nr:MULTISPECIES: hypothetical protein [Bombella]MCT6855874.1 hypothetical protein [Bombella apis]MCX5619957.1 hypothetical protein [Bombella pollinis]MUG05148.1 hypothetical protein [Bombella sp. ESL0378]MUG90695.1 hypothetical protein [Bombella sp. ESL0385]
MSIYKLILPAVLLLPALTSTASTPAMAQHFYGGNAYLLRPPPAPPPAMREFTHLPPPPPPPPSFGSTWQRDDYRPHEQPAPWAGPLWGSYRDPQLSVQYGWNAPAFTPWGNYITSQAPYLPSPPSRSCVDQNCTSP